MFAVHNETVCEQATHGGDDTGRVVATLQCYCEDVPAWVSGEAFLSPSATILLAILAVVLYSFRQLRPLFFKALVKLFERVFGAVKVDAKVAELANIFAAFEQLAPQMKDSFQFQLRHKLARKSAAAKDKDGGANNKRESGEAETKIKKEGAQEKSQNVDITFASRFLEMPSMVVNLEEEAAEEEEKKRSTTTREGGNSDQGLEAGLRERSLSLDDGVELTAMTEDMRGKGAKLGEGVDEEHDNNQAQEVKAHLDRLVSDEWIQWYLKLNDDDQAEVLVELRALDIPGVQKEADEKEDRKDNAAILLLQLCLLLWVSADYSFLLEHPKGGFVCQWSYIASIVM